MSEKDTALAVLAGFASCLSPVALFVYLLWKLEGCNKVSGRLISVDIMSRVIWIIYGSIQGNVPLIGSSVAAVVGYLLLLALARQQKKTLNGVLKATMNRAVDRALSVVGSFRGQTTGFQGLVGHSPRTQGCAPQR